MKEQYEKPTLSFEYLEKVDVLLSSGGGGGGEDTQQKTKSWKTSIKIFPVSLLRLLRNGSAVNKAYALRFSERVFCLIGSFKLAIN